MRKIIKQYGNTIVITLTPDELLAYNLKVGDIVKGYRFKGGNPSDPKSWEKQ